MNNKILYENQLKVGDKVKFKYTGESLNGREGIITKRTKRTITMDFEHSTVKVTFISGVPALDLGITLI